MNMHEILLANINLTRHFKYTELNKHLTPCNNVICHNLMHLALFLEQVRVFYGKPLQVNSGFRSEEVNKACGGVPNSYHLLGKAVDFRPVDARDYGQVASIVSHFSLDLPCFVKFYPTQKFIHIQFGERDESPLNLLPYFPFNYYH